MIQFFGKGFAIEFNKMNYEFVNKIKLRLVLAGFYNL